MKFIKIILIVLNKIYKSCLQSSTVDCISLMK